MWCIDTQSQKGERYIPRMVRMGVESSVHPMVKAITLASLLDAESDKGNSVLKKEQVEFEGFRTSTAQIAWDFALPVSPDLRATH